MPEENPDLFERLLALLAALIMPVWNDLIVLIPIVLILIVAVYLVFTARQWRNAGPRNEPRLVPRSAGTPPPGVHLPGPSWWPFFAPIAIALIFFGVIFNPLLIVLGLLVGVIPLVGWLRDANREWQRTAVAESVGGGHAQLAATPVALLPSGTFRMPRLAELPAPEPAAPEVQLPPGIHLPGPSPWPFFAPIAIAVVFYGLIFSPILIVGGVVLGAISAIGWLLDANREWRQTDAIGHPVATTMDPQKAWPRRLVPLFATVIGFCVLLVMLPTIGGWLAGLAPAEATPTPIVVPARPEISASNSVSFDTRTLVVPAGRAFELVFHNLEAGVPHNVKITDGPDQATVYFDGEVINGVADVVYAVPALEPGGYYFLCRIHPNMNGSVDARPEAGPGGGPAGPPVPPGGASPSP